MIRNTEEPARLADVERFLPDVRRKAAHLEELVYRASGHTTEDVEGEVIRLALAYLDRNPDFESLMHGPLLRRWLLTTCYHVQSKLLRDHEAPCRDFRRQQCLASSLALLADAWHRSPSSAVAARELEQRLHEAIDKLPPRQRSVVRRVKLEGMTAAQYASARGRTYTSAKSLLQRALRTLAGLLGSRKTLFGSWNGTDGRSSR